MAIERPEELLSYLEAETPDRSFQDYFPRIRSDGAEIWVRQFARDQYGYEQLIIGVTGPGRGSRTIMQVEYLRRSGEQFAPWTISVNTPAENDRQYLSTTWTYMLNKWKERGTDGTIEAFSRRSRREQEQIGAMRRDGYLFFSELPDHPDIGRTAEQFFANISAWAEDGTVFETADLRPTVFSA